jgi:type III secretory pathway component EscV
LTRGTEAGGNIILFFSGLIKTVGTAGIITALAGIIASCAAVAFAAKKGSARIAKLALQFITRKDDMVKQAYVLGALDGAGKFIAGNASLMICTMTVIIFGGIGIGIRLHGQTLQGAAEIYISFGICGGIFFVLPYLLLSIAVNTVSGRVYRGAGKP